MGNEETPNLAAGNEEFVCHMISHLVCGQAGSTAETTDNLVGLWLFNFACAAVCLFCYLYSNCHLEHAQNMEEIPSKIA